MLAAVAPDVAGQVPVSGRARVLGRIWDAPLRAHLAALALMLLALVPVIGTSSSFLSDEGAAVVQGRALASGRGWIVREGLPSVDPEGRYYPLVNSERGTRGFAPLAKHPLYSVLVGAADKVGGVTAMVLLSLAGTLAAAGLGAALASRFDPALARPAVWVIGLASPLLFDGFLVMGHTLAAALAVGAVLAAVVAIDERRPLAGAAVAPCIAGAVFLRSEAVLFALSLAAVSGVVALTSRHRRPALMVAASAAGAAVSARALETAWVGRIVGVVSAPVPVPAPLRAGFLRGRVDGFLMTWLLPDYRASQPLTLLLLTVATGLAAAAVASRVVPLRPARVLVPSALAAGAAVLVPFAAPAGAVPGLLIAFPLLGAGLLVLRRAHFGTTTAVALGTSALFAAAVVATQYPTGGTGEWGGRYFALAIPVVVPVVLLALGRHGRTLLPVVRHGAVGALVVCSLVLTTTAALALRTSHQSWDRWVDEVRRAEEVAGPGRPVVTTWSAAPRFAWPILDRSPWLLTRAEDLGALRSSLRANGFDRFVFVTVDMDADRARLGGLEVIWASGSAQGGGRGVLVVAEGRGGT